ncbi:MAG: N-acetyl sugar amidotransferase [Candidatus Hydrogenedentales bacterium]
MNQIQTISCKRCLFDSHVAGFRLDEDGICNYCHMQDHLEERFPTGETGERILHRMAAKIRKAGRNKAHDCIVGVSGGRDTSYCLYYAKEKMGLRPLAVHFDNGWDSDSAKSNLEQLCKALDVALHTVTMDWEDSRELTNCTIRACVPYIDLTNDIGIASALYRTAAERGIRYILLSHSFREEGITPLKWNYMDARYTRSLIRRFATKKLKHFQNTDIHHFFYWIFMKRISVVNITNYYDDRGSQVDDFLKERFGWEDTGDYHMDNELFSLVYYYALKKFGYDWRIVDLSAKIRSGVLTREEAQAIFDTPAEFENEVLVKRCLEKQELSEEEFAAILKAPNKFFTDYPNYYFLLRRFRFFFKLLCRLHILPIHAYEKYFDAV